MFAMLPFAYSLVLFLSGATCGFFVWVWYRSGDELSQAEYRRHSQKLRDAVKREQDYAVTLQSELTQRLAQLRSVDEINHQLAKKLKQTQSLFLDRDKGMKTATERADVTLRLLDQERTAKNELQSDLDLARQQLSTVQTEIELIKRSQRSESKLEVFDRKPVSTESVGVPVVLKVVFDEPDSSENAQGLLLAETQPSNGTRSGSDSSAAFSYHDPILGKIYRSRPAEVDDLTKIAGIAKMLEAKLHEQGIYTFEQIMNWDDAAISAFSELLDTFKDRVERNNWVEQAAYLYQQKHEQHQKDSPAA